MRRMVVLWVMLWCCAPPAVQAQPRQEDLVLVSPVRGSVIRGFDPGTSAYSAGNRGIEFRVSVGDLVIAAMAGQVTFAGRIGAEFFVTVTDARGRSATHSYLAVVLVRQGQVLTAGAPIGFSSDRFQLGLKIAGDYADPAPYLDPRSRHAFLIARAIR